MMFHKQRLPPYSNPVFTVVCTMVIFVFTLTVLIPILNIIALSFSSSQAVASGDVFLIPKEFTLANYAAVFKDEMIFNAFVVSVLRTVVGVVTHTIFTAMVAYPLSKQQLMGRKIYIGIGIVTMFVGGGMIPFFLLIRSLGLLNSFWVYIIPALFSFFDMILIMNYFRDQSPSMEESAKIDGANTAQIFLRIALPIALPILAAIALFNGVGHWNDYMTTKMYINNERLYPIQMKIYEIIVQQQFINSQKGGVGVNAVPITAKSIQLATIVISTAPIVLIYPFLQKYFITGMTIGAVKE